MGNACSCDCGGKNEAFEEIRETKQIAGTANE